MENQERGKLLVSTKATATGRKAFQIGAAALFIVLAGSMIPNFDIFREMGRDMFRSSETGEILGWVLIVGLLAMAAFGLITTFLGSQSFCDVYENAVVGKTALSRNQPNTPMQSFELNYNEITNVTEAGKSLIIYTNYMKYEVLALKNRTEALREIRKRMQVKV